MFVRIFVILFGLFCLLLGFAVLVIFFCDMNSAKCSWHCLNIVTGPLCIVIGIRLLQLVWDGEL